MSIKKLTIVIIAVTILLIGGLAAYFVNKKIGSKPTNTTAETINLNPPTEQDKKSGDARKDQIVEEQVKKKNNPHQKTATVLITDAAQYGDAIEVRAFIPDHYEDGTCTIKFQKDSSVITKDTPAYRDASTTICTNPLFKRSQFPSAGDWTVSVSYESPGASGTSETKIIKLN